MPLENLEEEGLEKNPNLELALNEVPMGLREHVDDAFLKDPNSWMPSKPTVRLHLFLSTACHVISKKFDIIFDSVT